VLNIMCSLSIPGRTYGEGLRMKFTSIAQGLGLALASTMLLIPHSGLAQTPAPMASSCVPASPGAPPMPPIGGAGQPDRRPVTAETRALTTTQIPGVVAGGLRWAKIWQGAGNSADGLLPTKSGGVLVAQEDFDTVLQIEASGKASTIIPDAKGIGSLSMDREGRLYGAHRTERPGSTKPDIDKIVNAITELAPQRHVISDKWADGSILTTRPNDLAADGHGGAYFTSGCLYYAQATGAVVLADNLNTNGVIFSRDDKVLYVTNGTTIVAFDVVGVGKLENRRVFATLSSGGTADGLAIDDGGRLYVTSQPGVQVFDTRGAHLGLIPTPRAVISIAFSGPQKKTLYVVGSGADDDNGRPIRQGPQQTAATLYSLPMIVRGIQGRAK